MPRALRGLAAGGRFPPAYWTQPYQPVAFPGFGKGLNLRDQPDAVPQDACFDCLDVTFSQRGAVKSRDGYGLFTASALTNAVDSMTAFYKSDGTKQLLLGCGTRLEALSTAGAIVSSAAGQTQGPYTFARYGQPNAEVAYTANGVDTCKKWDGAAWTAPTATVDTVAGRAMPEAGAIAVWSTSNRLVATGFGTTTGGPNGATSSPSHVYFSEPGNPEAWLTTNYVQLSPGDGEAIMGVVAWGDQVFVFKESKYFVFYSASTDSTGNPVFSYRTVATGCGLASRRALTAGRDGVYFMDRKGVYRTTGPRAPEPVSGNLDPLFLGSVSGLYSGSVISHTNITSAALTWHEERLYLAVPTAQSYNDRMFVFDTRYGWWSQYSIKAACLTPFRISSQAELVFGYATGTKDVGRHSSSYSSDAGAQIAWFWKGAFNDLGSPDVKTIGEWKIWGTGKLQIGYAHDFATSPPALTLVDFTAGVDTWSSSDTWGGTWAAGTVLAPQLVRRATRGTTFSLQVSAYQGNAGTLDRVTSHMREQEIPSTAAVGSDV